MSLIAFVGISLIWTGLLAGGAELLTRSNEDVRYARGVWRISGLMMVMPWLIAGFAVLWPSAVADLPVPDIPDFGFSGGVGDTPDGIAAVPLLPVSVSTLILGLLCTGWAFRLMCAVRAQIRLQRLKSSSKSIDDVQLQALAKSYAHDLSLRDVPRLLAIDGLPSPFAAGIQERQIYLPCRVVGSGHEPMVIAHESLHIATGDLITRPFERLIADILWFSPFAWIARRRLDYFREAVCDAATIELTGERKAYARALVDVARTESAFTPLPVASLILSDRSSLKRRVTSLMSDGPAKPTRLGLVAVLSLILAFPLAVAQGVKMAGPSDVFTHPIVAKGKISSTFRERKDPFTNKQNFHLGIDIAGELGELVMTPAPGKVIFADYKKGYGKTVMIELADGRLLLFGQLKKVKVKKGDFLEAGHYVGLLGESGRSTGPHLHFEVRKPVGTEKTDKESYKSWDPQSFDIDFIGN